MIFEGHADGFEPRTERHRALPRGNGFRFGCSACGGECRRLRSQRARHPLPRTSPFPAAREHNLKKTISLANSARRAHRRDRCKRLGGRARLPSILSLAESQRRFMESMSSWARQYVEQLRVADIDFLDGIPRPVPSPSSNGSPAANPQVHCGDDHGGRPIPAPPFRPRGHPL